MVRPRRRTATVRERPRPQIGPLPSGCGTVRDRRWRASITTLTKSPPMTILQTFSELVHQRHQRESAKRSRPVPSEIEGGEVAKLDVKNLNFFYGEKQALFDVSMT